MSAYGVSYTLAALPDEDRLRSDLQAAVRAYRALTFRGGLESDASPLSDVAAEFELPSSATVAETRRYALHMKIERNPTAAKLAKRYHGTTCQVCGLNFEDRYGPIGAGFIEAHHLKPISSLEEGVSVPYDVVEDFAVLCSNCHRMIHRTGDPGDLAGIRMLLRSREG